MAAPRILIVEDDAIVAHDLHDHLVELGYEPTGVLFSGEEAIAELARIRPDLVLLDIRLQGELDGVQVAEEVRSAFDVPVVYLTGHTDEATLQRAKCTQPLGYLVKPFESAELRSTIEIALYKHTMERRLRESEKRYRALSELASDYAYSVRIEPDGVLVLEWASDAFSRVTGFHPGRAFALHDWQRMVPPAELALLRDRLQLLLAGQEQELEHSILTTEGEQRWVRHFARPVWDLATGQVMRLYGAAQDITAHRLAQQELHKAYGELEIRVQERTADLLAANAALQDEIAERRHAQEALQRRNRDLQLLNRVISIASNDQGVHAVLSAVCRELVQALDASQAAVALHQGRAGEDSVVAECSAQGNNHSCSRAPDLPVLLVSPQKSVLKDNGGSLIPRLPTADAWLHCTGTASMLALPLFVQGRVAGSLSLSYAPAHTFAEDEISLLQGVAEQLSAALARAHLAEAQRRLSAAVDQSAGAVLITDTQGRIEYVNAAFERATHYSQAEVLGQTPRILKSGQHNKAFYEQLWQAITAGQVWQGRFADARKDGTYFYQDATITPVRNTTGEIVNYVATMRDVTREIQLEEQFRQAQKIEALGRLAGSVAHDFNNLLTIIQMSARLLEQKLPPDEAQKRHVERILKTSQRATDLIKQLLRFGRQETIAPRIVDLNHVVQDVVQIAEGLLPQQIQLRIVLGTDLWPIRVSPTQMEQVVMNLVVNARDAIANGGSIQIETANVIVSEPRGACFGQVRPGRHVLVAVRDTGVGMDDRVQAHLFEPFFTTKAPGIGTGLGLPTVYGIVTQAGGHICVHSRPGHGATFEVFLPCAHPPDTAHWAHEGQEQGAEIAGERSILKAGVAIRLDQVT